jgi:hypothetical protein
LARFLRDPWSALHVILTDLRTWLIAWGPEIGPVAVIAVVGLVVAARWWRARRQRRLTRDARVVTVLAPPTVDPAGAEAVWANLVGLLRPAWKRLLFGQPHLAFEYVFSHHGVHLQMWVPGAIPPGIVERAIEAAWPGAHTRTRPATAPIPTTGREREPVVAVGGELRLARSEALPIRSDFPRGVDPVRALLGAPVGLGPRERAVVQVLARPVAGHRVRSARRAARRLHTGHSPRLVGRVLDTVQGVLAPGPSRPRRPSGTTASAPAGTVDRQTSLEYAAQDRVITTKQRGHQYETRIRYAVAAVLDPDATSGQQAAVREVLRGRAHAVASAFAPFAEHNSYARRRLRHPLPVVAARHLARGDLLSVPELAVLAHLPTDEKAPGVQRAGAQALPPPPGVPANGPEVKPLGVTDTGTTRPVGVHVADARHHLHILWATGSGKSELMGRMILDDADAGRGVVVVDPKGDLVADVLSRLPARLADRVVLFDADSKSRPPCLNPLEGKDSARTVDNLVSIFSRIYAASWGPRTDDILRAGLLTLTAQPGTPTLVDLPKLLTVPSFRARVIDTVGDEVLAGFWTWYEQLSEPARASVIAPLMNKVRGFLLRPFVRAAIAGGPSTVDMDMVLDQGGICLVRISKDALGMETARLVGSIVVARTWQAATRRARLPQRQRRDASLLVDECHNFLNLPYALEDMLAEARAYRLAIVLAHQYLAQLTPELEQGISTNARSKIFFNASPEDAKHLARHTAPRLSEHDLSHLGAFHAAARLVVHGEEVPAFTLRTEKMPAAVPGRARLIRAAARANNRRALATGTTTSRVADGATNRGARRPGDPRRAA